MKEMIEARIPLALAGAADRKWIETDPGRAWMKLLWADTEAGSWATLLRWKKGYAAPSHVHLHDAHFILLSGSLAVRDTVFGPGDYGYEPKDAIHDATIALEDCVYFFLSSGPIRFVGDETAGAASYDVTCNDIIATDAAAA